MNNPKNKYILETRNICKSFGTLMANDRISIKVREGSIHAVMGENGAGKSTLMNVLTNILKQDYGDIILNGNKVTFKTPIEAARHGIGMVHQEFMLANQLTVLDNIIAGFEVKKGIFIDRKKSRKKVEEICELYNFPLPLDDLIDELPVAVLQQIEIVKILYRGANLIILDEPTSALTPQGVEGLFRAMKELKKTGKTILFITHKLNEVFAVSDEISVLRDGKLVGTYLSDDINTMQLASLMVGREVIMRANKLDTKPGEVVLRTENLRVLDADGIERVKGVSFEVRAGEIVGIAGVAGSGQQYLVQALFGLTRPEAGSEIEFKGKSIIKKLPLERRKLGIGIVPQDRIGAGCNVNASLWETAIMGYHRVRGFTPKGFINHKQANAYTNKVVENFDVRTQNINDKVGALSGGNKQKLIVGKEFLMDYKLLLIEDPTRGIDVGAIEYIWEKLIALAAEGVAVLMVSHELNEVMQLSDRTLVMYDGHLRDGGKHQELTEEEIGLLMLGGERA